MKTITSTNYKQSIRNVSVGDNVRIYDFVNLYDCEIGDNSQIGTFVEIQKNAVIGKKCRIQSHTFICEGVTIEDEVFIGHNVTFINDKHPSVGETFSGTWKLEKVVVKKGASIGSGSIIMGGVTIGKNAFVAAGAVVTKDVADDITVVGIPAKPMR